MTSRGRLLVFEGMDSVGKTTLSQALKESLCQQAQDAEWFSFPGRHSGSLGALIYALHHNPSAFDLGDISPLSRQALHIAAHIDTIQKSILPTLNSGVSAVLDRFWWSTLVYGPKGEGNQAILRQLVMAEKLVWSGVRPDAIFLITRSQPIDPNLGTSNWIAMQDDYRALASDQGGSSRVFVVENEGTIAESLSQIITALATLTV